MRTVAVPVAALLVAAAAAAPAGAAPSRPSLDGAASAILIDASDGHAILQKRPDERRAVASTTKLMTALLALERAKPSDVFTSPGYSAIPAESKIDLRAGERMRVQDLMEALLLESANDAAVTIARGVAGSRSRFVEEMNRRAAQLGLAGTHYANPIGLDDPGNYSTARDLATLAARLMRDRRFAGIVSRVQSVLESGARRRVVSNRNKLVGRYPGVDGVKTGHTIQARFVLIGAAHRGGARVVSVVLGEPSEAARDSDTLALLRYGLSLFKPREVLRRGQALARPRVKYRDERVALVPVRPLRLTLREGERVGRQVQAPRELGGPLPAGHPVGYVTIVADGRAVRKLPLVTASEVRAAGIVRKTTSALGWPLTFLVLLGILIGGAFLARRVRAGRRTAAR